MGIFRRLAAALSASPPTTAAASPGKFGFPRDPPDDKVGAPEPLADRPGAAARKPDTKARSVPAMAVSPPPNSHSVLCERLDLAGVDALQDVDLDADAWDIADGPDRVVRIKFNSWEHFEPDLPTPKRLDDRFYNEMAPVHVVRVLSKYVKLRSPAKRAEQLWRAVDVAYHRREQAAATRALAELLIERFAARHRNVDRRPEVYVWHGKLLEECGRWDEAAALLEQAIALGIDDRTVRGFTGRLETLRRKAKRAQGRRVVIQP